MHQLYLHRRPLALPWVSIADVNINSLPNLHDDAGRHAVKVYYPRGKVVGKWRFSVRAVSTLPCRTRVRVLCCMAPGLLVRLGVVVLRAIACG